MQKSDFNPKVTIIIPVYNGEDYLSQAIDSALNQTYENKEIIVIDDGSKDKTQKIAKSYGTRIQYIYKENGGVASALNAGINAATGEYISWLSHDDLYYPEKVEEEVNFLKQQKDKNTVIACDVELVDKDLNLIEKHHLPEALEKYPMSFITFDVTTGLNGCALLISKKMFEKNGLFDLKLKVTQDYDMWSRFAETGKFAILNKVLVKSRQHANQGSRTIKSVQQEVDDLHSRLITKIKDEELKNYFENDLEKMFATILLYKNAMQSYHTAILLYQRVLELYPDNQERIISFFNKNFLYEDSKEFPFSNSKKKRLLFYNNIWVRGGIERVLSTQFEYLKDDYDIFFATSSVDDKNGFKLPKEIHLIKVNKNIDDNLPVAILSLCYLLKIDLFIGTQNLDLNILKTYQLLKKHHFKSIASNHYSYYLPYELKYLYPVTEIRNDCYDCTEAVVWTNRMSAKLYAIKGKNSVYIPNQNSFEISNKITPNNKTILCVGRFDDGLKHLDWTLEAFSKAVQKDPDLKLVVVGKVDMNSFIYDTYNCKLKDFIERMHIPTTNIEFVGQSDNVEKYYKQASLFLLTSQTEGFGMVVTEAATFGVPTIAFNILGLDSLITDGKDGYLIDCYHVDKMAEKIIEYFSDNQKMTMMKKEALEKAKKYTKEVVLKEWKKLLLHVLEGKEYNSVEPDLSSEEVLDSTAISFKNIGLYMDMIEGLKVKETSLARKVFQKTFGKIIYQYQTYGWKKAVKEIVYYPIKKVKRLFKK